MDHNFWYVYQAPVAQSAGTIIQQVSRFPVDKMYY